MGGQDSETMEGARGRSSGCSGVMGCLCWWIIGAVARSTGVGSGCVIAGVNGRGGVCEDSRFLSVHQPNAISPPPLPASDLWQGVAAALALFPVDNFLTIILALAITKAQGTDGTQVAAAIPVVSSSPGGDAVTSYKDGIAALQAGKKTRYIGASGPYDFNDQHNVFGDFDAVQADATTGKLQTVETLSAADLKAATVTP